MNLNGKTILGYNKQEWIVESGSGRRISRPQDNICSCSPPGEPHSYNCPGWFPGDPAWEDKKPDTFDIEGAL